VQLDQRPAIRAREQAMKRAAVVQVLGVDAPRDLGRVRQLREAALGEGRHRARLVLLAHRQVEIAVWTQGTLRIDAARQRRTLQNHHRHPGGAQPSDDGLKLSL